MQIPDNPKLWLANITLFGITQWQPQGADTLIHTIVVPSAWSLNVELVYYLLLGFGFAYSPKLLLAGLGASVLYAAYALTVGESFLDHYHSLLSGSIPFCLGGLLYHLQKQRLSHITLSYAKGWGVILCCWAVIAAISFYNIIPYYPYPYALYFSVPFTVTATLALAMTRKPESVFLQGFDNWCGDHSYGVFLSHFLAGLLCFMILPHAFADAPSVTDSHLLPGLPLTFLIAMAIRRYIEIPLIAVRAHIRGRKIAAIDDKNRSHLMA